MSKNLTDKKSDMASTHWSVQPPRTELEFLAFEAGVAKTALANTAKAAAENIIRVADPRVWTQDYPWQSTGAAAVAGFFVATRGATSPPTQAEASGQESSEAKPQAPSPWDTVTALLLSTGTEALKGVLTPWLMGKVQEVMQKASGDKGESEGVFPNPG